MLSFAAYLLNLVNTLKPTLSGQYACIYAFKLENSAFHFCAPPIPTTGPWEKLSHLLQRDELKVILVNVTVSHFDKPFEYYPKQQN